MGSLVSTKMAMAWLLVSRGHPTIPRGLRTRLMTDTLPVEPAVSGTQAGGMVKAGLSLRTLSSA